jgi:hypothetical protein
MSEKCKEQVSRDMWHTNRCYRNAWKDGYCKQHHPDSVKTRREASHAKWERDMAASEKRYDEQAVARLRAKGYTVIPPEKP